MQFVDSPLPGVLEFRPRIHQDERGSFVKTFHESVFSEAGLETQFREEYYSQSVHGVLRGLHFQLPPWDHAKFVYCVAGEVLDVALDLRRGSPTYGCHASFRLTASEGNGVYLPPGMAHGFQVTSESAILVYKVSTVYSPEHDAGIRWDSAGISWPLPRPTLSPRDASFPALAEFHSPFTWQICAAHRAA